MSEYSLPLFIEYQSSVRSRRIELELNGGNPDAPLWHYINCGSSVVVGVLLILAVIVAAKAKQSFFICLFFVGLGQWSRWVWQAGALQRNSVVAWLNEASSEITKLEFTEAGFVEHDRGVESFAPWSAMKWYVLKDGVLCVSLANNLRAVIAGDTLKPANVTLEILEKILLDHGISRRAGNEPTDNP